MSSQPVVNIEAEQYVLGSMMLSENAVLECVDSLTGREFYRPAHENIFQAITELFNRSEPADPLTVSEKLRSKNVLEKIGGAAYLHSLIQIVPTPANAGYYAEIVVDTAAKRRLQETSIKITQLVDSGADSRSIADMARNYLEEAVSQRDNTIRPMSETLSQAIDELEHPVRYTLTPWNGLSRIISGWRPEAIYLIGARPATGKSVFALTCGLDLARGGNVLFCSMEMGTNELINRAISHKSGVSATALDHRNLNERAWDKVSKATPSLHLPLFINDHPHQSITNIRTAARKIQRTGPLKAIIIDYVQLLSTYPGDKRSRYEQMSEISRGLKLLAKEFQVPIIALSQLNRESEKRTDKRPTMADLRDTGSLEQDADVVILLHRDTEDPESVDATKIKFIVAKNRHGRIGEEQFTFKGHLATIEDSSILP